jgi:uncharacterized protein YqgV (UPF0045/DUF77 family)
MIITIEISMYPFQGEYRPLIGDFIHQLNQYPDLTLATSATSTIATGEFQHVMHTLTEMLQWSYEKHGKAVFVTKFIPGYDGVY